MEDATLAMMNWKAIASVKSYFCCVHVSNFDARNYVRVLDECLVELGFQRVSIDNNGCDCARIRKRG